MNMTKIKKKHLHLIDPSGDFLQPPQTTASMCSSGVPPRQTRSFAVPLKDLADRLTLCLSVKTNIVTTANKK